MIADADLDDPPKSLNVQERAGRYVVLEGEELAHRVLVPVAHDRADFGRISTMP